MVSAQLEVGRQLVAAVTAGLGLQLDEPQPVIPQDRLIGGAALLVLVPPGQVELVDEDLRRLPRLAEAEPIKLS